MAFESPSYNEIVQAVLSYYDSSSPFWGKVNNGTATAAEIYDAYSRIPQFKITRTMDGLVMGTDWSQSLNKLARTDYADPTERQQLAEQINDLFSNSRAADYGEGNAYNVNINGSWSGDGTNGYNVTSGSQITGSPSILATIADKVSLAVTGVNVGAKIGAAIDRGIYNINPAWWDENLPTINPDTWTSLAGQDEAGKQFVRTLFGIRDDGVTAYIDENVLAQYYQVLRDKGAFEGDKILDYDDIDMSALRYPSLIHGPFYPSGSVVDIQQLGTGGAVTWHREVDLPAGAVGYRIADQVFIVSSSPGQVTLIEGAPGRETTRTVKLSPATVQNRTYYYLRNPPSIPSEQQGYKFIGPSPSNNNTIPGMWDLGYITFEGSIKTTGGIDGVKPLESEWQYPPTNITGTDVSTVLQQLKQEYPDLFTDAITESTLQDDGSIKDRTYVPIPWAVTQPISDSQTEIDTQTQPTTKTDTEIDTKVKPDTFTDIVTRTPTNNPPDEGDGEQEPFIMPTGSASSLWAVYHPSQSQLNAFGAWLWSSDFVEQLKRLFNDPMQAIIGVHKVFAPIPTGGSQNIKCGYLDSGVSSPTVSSQYTEVDCGTVDCREYFGNVFDYDPHTKVSIYLPFIGVVPLKVSEVMRASINVTYGVDVITGACLAKVKVTRDGGGGILYSYGGSCACHYPISSGSYAGIISGIVTSAIGIAGGIMTGNPLSAVGGAMAGLHQAHTEVQRSGGFTGCAGAMGPKIPYLIIDRPQTRLAADFEAYQGKPANSTQFIGDCSGYVRATEVHFSAPGVFDEEAREVESLLKAGVKLD